MTSPGSLGGYAYAAVIPVVPQREPRNRLRFEPSGRGLVTLVNFRDAG
jgi:hypothetical protein